MKRKAPRPEALPPLPALLLCLALLPSASPCGAEGAEAPDSGCAVSSPPAAGAAASLVSILEGGRSFESGLVLSWMGVDLRLRAFAGAGEPAGGGRLRAGLEGASFMLGPAKARGLLAYLSSPLSLAAGRGGLPLGLDPGLSSPTRAVCAAAGPVAAFAFLHDEADGGKEAPGGAAAPGSSAAGGLGLDLPAPGGRWSALAAGSRRSVGIPPAWALDGPQAHPGGSAHLALSREGRGALGSSLFAAGASLDRTEGTGLSFAMHATMSIRPVSMAASLAALSPAFIDLSGAHPDRIAALGLGAGFAPRPGVEFSAAFEAVLARGEARREGGFPFVSRSLELSSRLPFPSGGRGSLGQGFSFGVDAKGSAFRIADLELRGEEGGEAWAISASAGRREAPKAGGTSYPLSLGLGLAPLRGRGRRIEPDLGFSLRSTLRDCVDGEGGQAAEGSPRFDCRLGLSLPLPAKARLGLVFRMKGARLGVVPADAEKPLFFLDLRYESGTIGLGDRHPPSSLDDGKALSCP